MRLHPGNVSRPCCCSPSLNVSLVLTAVKFLPTHGMFVFSRLLFTLSLTLSGSAIQLYTIKPVSVMPGSILSTQQSRRRAHADAFPGIGDAPPSRLPTPATKRPRTQVLPPSPSSPIASQSIPHPVRGVGDPSSLSMESFSPLACTLVAPAPPASRRLPGVEPFDAHLPAGAVGMRVQVDAARSTHIQRLQCQLSEQVDHALISLKGQCSKCFVTHHDYDHDESSCPSIKSTDSNAQWAQYKEAMKLPTGYCYYCFRPQVSFLLFLHLPGPLANIFAVQQNKSFFGWHESGPPRDCPYPHIIRPALYALWHDTPTRARLQQSGLLKKASPSFPTNVKEYVKALLKHDSEHNVATFILVFQWATRQGAPPAA